MNTSPKRAWPWIDKRLEVRDPSPLPDTAAFWRVMAQAATIGMFALFFGAFLYFARPFLLPVLSAIVVGMTIGPMSTRLEKSGLPAWGTALLTVIVLTALIVGAVVFLSQPISDLVARAPEMGNAIKDKFHWIDAPIAALRELQELMPSTGQQVVVLGAAPTDMLGSVVAVVGPAVVQFLLFFVTLFFFVLSRTAFRNYTVNMFFTREGRLRALKTINDIEHNLSAYLLTVTCINLGVGVVIAAGMWLIGLPNPLLWGALAFALNYIPYIGPAIVHVLLFAMGLLVFPTLTGALIPPAFSIAVATLEGQFVTPNIVGRRLAIAPLTVFLSVAFWAWLWGPIGAFLAMPILIIGLVTLNHLYPVNTNTLPG